jgi:bifunctional DNA-binding transcriptional regulator/antitoxin component of YhaV-PrlF toxin-antitoxin module
MTHGKLLPSGMAICHTACMELSIDKFGRVLLPKKLREHLGVGKSLKVEVKEMPNGVLLTPVRHGSGLMRKDGILILRGGGDDSHINWDTLVQDEREERIRHIAEL